MMRNNLKPILVVLVGLMAANAFAERPGGRGRRFWLGPNEVRPVSKQFEERTRALADLTAQLTDEFSWIPQKARDLAIASDRFEDQIKRGGDFDACSLTFERMQQDYEWLQSEFRRRHSSCKDPLVLAAWMMVEFGFERLQYVMQNGRNPKDEWHR